MSDLHFNLYKSISDANTPRVFEHWHASSIAECPKAHYLKRKGQLPPIDAVNTPTAAKMLRWKAGHLMEEAIRPHVPAMFEGEHEILSNQRLTSDKLDLTGEYDNFVPDLKTIVEVKSVHDYAFIERDGVVTLKEQVGTKTASTGRVTKVFEPKKDPYLHHQLQNHSYVMLMREQGIEVERINYVYISLSGRIVVYETRIKPDYLDNITNRLEVLNQSWANDTAPECICDKSHPLWDGVMQWCDYRTESGCCKEV